MLSHLLRTISGVLDKNVQFNCQHFNRRVRMKIFREWTVGGINLFFIEFRFLRKKKLLSGGNWLPGFWKVPIFCAEVCFDWPISILKSQEFSIVFRFWVTFFSDFWPNFSSTFLETAIRISRGFSSEQLFSQKNSHLLTFSRTLCENCSECLVNISIRVFLIVLYQCKQMFE